MTKIITGEVRDDLLSRGFSRRHLMQVALLLTGGSTLAAFSPDRAWAQDHNEIMPKQNGVNHRIGGNEWPTGPMTAGLTAGATALQFSNRYGGRGSEHADFIRAVSQTTNVPEDHVSGWAGSTEGLIRTIVAFCSPTKGLVQASPGYDNPVLTARYLQAPFKAVSLKEDYSHDVKAMLAADPKAGIYYICNPNNPTATMTPVADIEWLVNNKPEGSIVLVDEAYIHASAGYPNNTCSHLVAQGKDVVVLRTFSKVFGMAGARLGFVLAKPDIQKKLDLYNNGGPNPIMSLPAMVCGTVSLTQHEEIEKRRKVMMDTKAMTIDFLRKRDFKIIGDSQANFFMVDWKTKSAKEMAAAFRQQGVQIAGPRWAAVWPTVSRVSIGTREDMQAFTDALTKIVAA